MHVVKPHLCNRRSAVLVVIRRLCLIHRELIQIKVELIKRQVDVGYSTGIDLCLRYLVVCDIHPFRVILCNEPEYVTCTHIHTNIQCEFVCVVSRRSCSVPFLAAVQVYHLDRCIILRVAIVVECIAADGVGWSNAREVSMYNGKIEYITIYINNLTWIMSWRPSIKFQQLHARTQTFQCDIANFDVVTCHT